MASCLKPCRNTTQQMQYRGYCTGLLGCAVCLTGCFRWLALVSCYNSVRTPAEVELLPLTPSSLSIGAANVFGLALTCMCMYHMQVCSCVYTDFVARTIVHLCPLSLGTISTLCSREWSQSCGQQDISAACGTVSWHCRVFLSFIDVVQLAS